MSKHLIVMIVTLSFFAGAFTGGAIVKDRHAKAQLKNITNS